MTLLQTDFLPTKNETFQAFRWLLQMQGGGIQPGVVGASDYKVVQRAAGANMSVDIGAGDAWAVGSSVARQGIYHQSNDAVVNTAFTNSDPTNPRIDQVFLAINDSSISGASDTPAIVVIAGTPTAGATLDNRTGATADATIAVTYPNRVRLADVLVPAASSSVVTANIRDRRPWARGFLGVTRKTTDSVLPSGGGWGAIDTVNMQQRAELGGAPVRVQYQGAYSFSTTAGNIEFGLFINGVLATMTGADRLIQGGLNTNMMFNYEATLQPTAGSYLIAPAWTQPNSPGVSATLLGAGSPSTGISFIVEELVRSNANNGLT